MKVWVMNLKDNREEKPELDKSKFDFCMEKGIVGIGWVGCSPENSTDAVFLQADAYLNEFKPGDIAWTKNPESGEQYICRIKSAVTETGDPEYNKYDISRYCTCIFEKAENLPEDIQAEDLISRSTISPANQRLNESTVKYFISDNKSGRKGLKITAIVLLTAVICAAVVFAVISISNVVTRKKHPILPYGIKFGDTYEEIAAKVPDDFINYWEDDIAYDKVSKTYKYLINDSSMTEYFSDILPVNFKFCDLSFNENKELFIFNFKFDQVDTEKVEEYILKAVDKENLISDDGTIKTFSAEYMSTDITINIMSGWFMITSDRDKPVYHEVPENIINSAFNSVKYRVGGFSINLREVLNKAAPDADYKYYSLSSRPDVIELPDDYEYIDYLSTSYVVEIKGDISPNPDIPYYVSEETDIAKVLLVFNEYDELLDYRIFDVCSQLNSYAVIYMTR